MVESTSAILINRDIGGVWQALSTPTEAAKWNTNLARPLDVPANYPHLEAGQFACWRYWIGPFPCILYDYPVQAIAHQTYAAKGKVWFIRFNECYTLTKPSPGQTHVHFVVNIWSIVPLIGPFFDKFILKLMTDITIAKSLSNLKKWCERKPD